MDYGWRNDCPDEAISDQEDILRMLDALLRDNAVWWDRFYSDRTKPVPFFADIPDESLVGWFDSGELKGGMALDLGCGPGRNAIYMAKQGCSVDAVDISSVALQWAIERATESDVDVKFICSSVFDLPVRIAEYDLVYDSGCFHHIPPHRRVSFLSFVANSLKSGGAFGLTCFGAGAPDDMGGADITDWQVYRDRSMHGGIRYSKERLMEMFAPILDVVELRPMKECEVHEGVYGVPFCWSGLFRKR